MACACKVNQEIDKIQKYYSYHGKTDGEKKPRMSINKKDAVITLFIYILLLPLVPLMIVFVILHAIFSKDSKINMGNFLRFIHKTRNGRKEQII